MADIDGDDSLSQHEYQLFFSNEINRDPSEAFALWRGIDTVNHPYYYVTNEQNRAIDDFLFFILIQNNDGNVDVNEYKSSWALYNLTFTDDEAEDILRMADENGDGVVTHIGKINNYS